MMHALTAPVVAAAFGRSPDWLYRNWPRMHRDEGMPAPIAEDPLAWDAAQFYCWLDRDLPADLKAAAAAFRAAAMTYIETKPGVLSGAAEIAEWRAELARRVSRKRGRAA